LVVGYEGFAITAVFACFSGDLDYGWRQCGRPVTLDTRVIVPAIVVRIEVEFEDPGCCCELPDLDAEFWGEMGEEVEC
jgi:hypothetical protein